MNFSKIHFLLVVISIFGTTQLGSGAPLSEHGRPTYPTLKRQADENSNQAAEPSTGTPPSSGHGEDQLGGTIDGLIGIGVSALGEVKPILDHVIQEGTASLGQLQHGDAGQGAQSQPQAKRSYGSPLSTASGWDHSGSVSDTDSTSKSPSSFGKSLGAGGCQGDCF